MAFDLLGKVEMLAAEDHVDVLVVNHTLFVVHNTCELTTDYIISHTLFSKLRALQAKYIRMHNRNRH